MRPFLGVVMLLAVSACAPVAPPPPSSASMSPIPVEVDCGAIQDALCASVAEAAELMTGTAPLAVMALPIPSGGGTPIEERYVVTLEPELGTEPSLVEVVRFEGSENWSARRLESMPAD
ncbi:MAG: hypothetical protein ACRDE6_07075 [Candidatus Limnocylindria bacterium]